MKVAHRVSILVCGWVALLVLGAAGCALESPRHRSARLSALALLVETRARLPQFHVDTVSFIRDSTSIEFIGWFDGDRLAILHQNARMGRASWSRERFYLVRGAMLACSSYTVHAPGEFENRVLETTMLFDAEGRPLQATLRADGRVKPVSTPALKTWAAMNLQAVHSAEQELVARHATHH